MGQNNYESYVDVSTTREVRFIFKADCWELARTVSGLTIEETLDEWTDNSFLILDKMVSQFVAPNTVQVQQIDFSVLPFHADGIGHGPVMGIFIYRNDGRGRGFDRTWSR